MGWGGASLGGESRMCEWGWGDTCDHLGGLPSLKPVFTHRPEGVGVKPCHTNANMDQYRGGGNPYLQTSLTTKVTYPTTNMEEVVAMGGCSLCIPHDGLQNVNPGINLDEYTTTKLDKMETSNGIEDGIDLGNTHHKFGYSLLYS